MQFTDEQMSGDELRTLLTGAVTPPPALTVQGLLQDGHRRVRRRRLATATAVGALAAAVALVVAFPAALPRHAMPARPAQSPVPTGTASTGPVVPPVTRTCPLAALAVPPGNGPAPMEISPNGRYIVGHTNVGQNFRPVYWTDGVPRMVPYPSDASSVELTGVTNDGTAVGALWSGRYSYVVRYRDGVLRKLPYPAGGPWYLAQQWINEAGDIMATVEHLNIDNDPLLSVVWPAGSDTPELITPPANVSFRGIAADGSLLAMANMDRPDLNSAYVFDRHGRNPRELPTPAGWNSLAQFVRGDWAVGEIVRQDGWRPSPPYSARSVPPGHVYAAAWNLRTGELVQQPGATYADVVGVDGMAVDSDNLLVLDRNNRYRLARPDLHDTSARIFITSVADDGQVVGWAGGAALRWQC